MTAAVPRSAAVVGGGIVGLSTGLALQARGLAVTVFDAPADRPSASHGNAGHIAVEQHEPLASFATIRSLPGRLMSRGGPASFPPGAVACWAPFGLRLLRAARPAAFASGKRALGSPMAEALPAWRRLMGDVGTPALLRERGNIVAWESVAGARRGRKALEDFHSPVARWRDLTADEARMLGGQLRVAPADAVCWEGSASVADPAAALDALRSAFVERGGTVDRRAASLDDARRTGADATVVAAGIRSVELMRGLGDRVPLIAERGYHIQSARTRWPMDLTSVVFDERSLVVTRLLTGLRATSFVEFTRHDAAPDARKWARLAAHAHALGLPFESSPQTWVGSRPTFPDYLPAIGRSAGDPRIFYAFGHQHLGLTLGPVTGEIVGALVCGDADAAGLAPFGLGRFR